MQKNLFLFLEVLEIFVEIVIKRITQKKERDETKEASLQKEDQEPVYTPL